MLHTTLHFVVALAWTLTSGFLVPDEHRPVTDPFDTVDLVDMPAEFVELARWSVELFHEAGLELPPIRFTHHGDALAPCAGREGLHRHIDGLSTIEICTTDAGRTTLWLVLHETAHAWAAHDLDEGRKAEFKTLRGWEHWRSFNTIPWHENGTEQAAEIIAWGLVDRPFGVVSIHDHSCDALDAGYRTLTGQAPLHGYRDHC